MPEPFTLYKLIVLYMLQKVDFPLTTSQISSFILDRGYTTYFTLQSVLSELAESDLVRMEPIRNTSYYTITAPGEETLHYFQNRISPTIREDIDQYMLENKIQLRDEVSIISDYYRNTADEFSVHCNMRIRSISRSPFQMKHRQKPSATTGGESVRKSMNLS